MRADSRNFVDKAAEYERSIKLFLKSWKMAGGISTIKHHYLRHLGTEAARTGSPRFYHTYSDESHHMSVRRIARRCSAENFSRLALGKLRIVFHAQADDLPISGNACSEFDFVHDMAT